MKNIKLITTILFLLFTGLSKAQTKLDTLLPVRGFCIKAPDKTGIKAFTKFIDEVFAPAGVNTLVLRVDYLYKYKSHPELVNDNALSEEDVKQLVKACQKNNIKLIPQFNLLGHQSWASTLNPLLREYPEFDETPHITIPEEYEWPNEDGLYCKSYCPLHPEVHSVVFDIIDELLEVFEADAFHAGLDEVFYISDDQCPRCAGRDKAELFAEEVTRISNHLTTRNARLWMWGDRLIDGKATGMGMWEASMNNTHRAIDMIPKEVVICDWHYERPDPTAAIFAAKGFDVITCPWRNGDVAVQQLKMMLNFRVNSADEMSEHFQGMMQTVWTSAENFMENYNAEELDETEEYSSTCFKTLFAEIGKLDN
jgi:hypothetical protein